MNSQIPKQFLELDGIPVILHSLYSFMKFDPALQVIIALPEDYFSYWHDLCEKHSFSYSHLLSKGGETRFQTVKNALTLIPDDRIVGIHDAVRPLVSDNTIERGYRDALTFGNAIPVIPVNESIRWSEGKKNQTINREHLRIVQTPQVFEANLIKRAYNRISNDSFTDDASVLEAMGETIHLFEGNRENIKITHPDDLLIAHALLKQQIL
jgi:2-C-methyl-D-erythritol 4-phosphate cytidylyltransferase